MKNFKKIIALVLTFVFAAALLVGCNTPTTTGTPTGTPAATPTGTAGTSKETVVVAYTIYAPMNFENEAGELVGFDTDLAKAVFEDLGYNVVFKLIDWEQKYTELESGTIDCIWNGFTSNGEDNGKPRSEYVDFTYNYMINKQVVVAKTGTVTDAASLSGKVGSAEKGSIGYSYLEGFVETNGAIVKDAKSQLAALQDMKLGGCDFVVLDEQLAKAYCGQGEYAEYSIVDGLSSSIEYYAIGFKKGSDLTAKVNATLEKFAANGKLTEIATTYSVQNAIVTDFADQK